MRNCNVSCKCRNNQQKELLILHSIFDERFQKVGINIMTFRNTDYLVVVDYFLKFPEIVQLPDKTAKSVVEQGKNIIARHVIPSEIVLDNMLFRFKQCFECRLLIYGVSNLLPRILNLVKVTVKLNVPYRP